MADKHTELAQRIVALSNADQTEVIVRDAEHALTRFTHESLNQSISSSNVSISVRAIVDKRTGVARTNRRDDASLNEVVERAIAIAKLAPHDAAQGELPTSKAQPAATPGAYVSATASANAQERARVCDGIFRVAESNKLWSAGYCSTSSEEITVANSHGTLASFQGTNAEVNVKLTGSDSTGFGEYYSADFGTLRGDAVAETAARKTRETASPKSVEPGPWTVILEPAAFGEFLSYVLGHFGAQQFDEGSSFFSESMDAVRMNDRFTLHDDYAHPLAPAMPFDYEGHPKMRLPLVENGRVRNILTDSYWAHKLSRENTGHALPAPNAGGPHASNIVVTAGDKSVEQLISETKRGLLVSRFWYIRTVDSKHAVVTGMTRDGTYLIENGKLAGGVKNLRFNQSILDALTTCEFASQQVRTGGYSYSLVVPAVKIDGFHFTSTTEF